MGKQKNCFCRFVNPTMEQLFSVVEEIMPLRFLPVGVGGQPGIIELSAYHFISVFHHMADIWRLSFYAILRVTRLVDSYRLRQI